MLTDDLATLIGGASIATEGEDLFAGGLPESPDAVVALIETPGRAARHVFGEALPPIEMPRVRIVVRGAANDYQTPRGIAEEIYQLLIGRGAETVNGGARYLTWQPIQPPYALGPDKSDRPQFGFNVEVWKEVSA